METKRLFWEKKNNPFKIDREFVTSLFREFGTSKFITVSDFRSILNVSRGTIIRDIISGAISSIKYSNKKGHMLKIEELIDYLMKLNE